MTSAHHPVGSTSRRPSCSEMNRPRPTASSNRSSSLLWELERRDPHRRSSRRRERAPRGRGPTTTGVAAMAAPGRSSRRRSRTGFERRCFRPCAESVEIDAPRVLGRAASNVAYPRVEEPRTGGRNRPKHHCTPAIELASPSKAYRSFMARVCLHGHLWGRAIERSPSPKSS